MSRVKSPDPANALAVGVVWLPVCTAIVALRFYARRRQNAPLLLDDWLCVPAGALTVGMCIAMIYGVATKCLGYPTPQPPPGQDPRTFVEWHISETQKLFWVVQLLQIPALTAVKLSCLFFYRRVFITGHNRIFHYSTLILIVISILWGILFLFAVLFQCGVSPSAWWTSVQTLSDYCPHALNLEITYATTDTVIDHAIVIVPIFPLAKLKMSFTRKLGVVAVFFLGTLTLTASIVRMVVYFEVVVGVKAAYLSRGADDQQVTAGMYWAVMESGLGLTGACLPTLYSLVSRRLRSSNHGTKDVTENLPRDIGLRTWDSKDDHTYMLGTQSMVGADRIRGPANHMRHEDAYGYGDRIRVQQTFGRTA